MDIGPGDLVECMNDNFSNLESNEVGPVLGQIYTIREIRPDLPSSPGDAVRLEEIKNPPQLFYTECSFLIQHFRPIRSIETGMEILRRAVKDALDKIPA